MSAPRLVLASASPRRAELLAQMALPFTTLVTDVDESRQASETPGGYVERLARAKAQAGFSPGCVVVGADTTVVIDDEILGKPCGPTEGVAMLCRLSGRRHAVYTGVAVYDGERLESVVVVSRVTFRDFDAAEAAAYWATGEGADKAGSYGIQGIGGILVERIEGSFSAVMGLPVQQTEALLRKLDIDTWSMRAQWLKNSS